MVTATWVEDVMADLASLGATFNAALREAGLPELVDWYSGEPRPFRTDATPYGWVQVAPGKPWKTTLHKQGVEVDLPVLLVVVLAAGTPADLTALMAGTLPRLSAELEQHTWLGNVDLGGWTLSEQDENANLDVYALPLTLTSHRAYRSVR